MRPFLLVFAMLCVTPTLLAQYVYTIKADSVKITNNCDTAELILENHTQNVLGFLYNKGKGRTEFRKILKLNDSTLLFGEDTLVIKGGGVITASNGLSVEGQDVRLGQIGDDPGGPAALTSTRTIPLNDYQLQLRNSEYGINFYPVDMDFTTPFTTVYQSFTSEGSTLTISPFELKIQGNNVEAYLSVLTGAASVFSISDETSSMHYQSGQFSITAQYENGTPAAFRAYANNSRLDMTAGETAGQICFIGTDTLFRILAPNSGDYISIGNTSNPSFSVFPNGNIAISNSYTDLGYKLNVNGTGYFHDKLHLNTVTTGTASDSILVINSSNKAVHKVAQSSIGNSLHRVTVTDANYTAATSDYLVAYVSISTGRTVTLPAASSVTNKTIIIKDESGSAGTHNITIDGFGSETIDGNVTKVINSNFGSITMYSNGADWFTIHQ